MNNRLTPRERKHLATIKEMDCIVCGAPGPSIAHHVRQHSQFTTLPLCEDCHVGNHNGIHRQQRIWKVKKLDELDALGLLYERLLSGK